MSEGLEIAQNGGDAKDQMKKKSGHNSCSG
jgi:hypothetical protein